MSQTHDTIVTALMEQLIAEGPDGMAQVFTALFNLALRLERERFLGAGLCRKERKAVMRVMPISFFLFLAGIAFGYLVLFPFGLSFLVTFADPVILKASITVGKYFSLFCTRSANRSLA